MRGLIVNLLLVVAVFAAALLALGGRMGPLEVTVLFLAQLAAIIYVVLRHVRRRRVVRTEPAQS
ncbi:hypothetical protein [Streptomyces sp. NPDC102347]|uniref:hypothetical protein n=1 Tax=Streptomyces sp. NPDC102347 TaxID=3366157 RepID=UPI00382CBB6D